MGSIKMEEYIEEVDHVADGIYLESVKVDLNKYVINGGMGLANIFGRRVQKSIVFPVAKLNYTGNAYVENHKYNRRIDLKNAALTATNYESAG